MEFRQLAFPVRLPRLLVSAHDYRDEVLRKGAGLLAWAYSTKQKSEIVYCRNRPFPDVRVGAKSQKSKSQDSRGPRKPVRSKLFFEPKAE